MSYDMPRTNWQGFAEQLGNHLSRAVEATGQALDYQKSLNDFNSFKKGIAKEVSDMMGGNYSDKQKQSVANQIMMSKDPDEVISKVAEFKMQGDLFAQTKEELVNQGNQKPSLPLPQFGIKADTYNATFLKPSAEKARAQSLATQTSEISADDAGTAALAQRHPNAPAAQPGVGAGPLTPEETQRQLIPFAGTDQQKNVDQFVSERRNTQDTQAQMATMTDPNAPRATVLRNAANATEGRPIQPNVTQIANATQTDQDQQRLAAQQAALEAKQEMEAHKLEFQKAKARNAAWVKGGKKATDDYKVGQVIDDLAIYSKQSESLNKEQIAYREYVADLITHLSNTEMYDKNPVTAQNLKSQIADAKALLATSISQKAAVDSSVAGLTRLRDQKLKELPRPQTAAAATPAAVPSAGRNVNVGGVNATIRFH